MNDLDAGRPMAQLSAGRPDHILEAATLLREGGVVVLPTDTVYGLAASIYVENAVSRIFRIKERPTDRRLPILLATAAALSSVAGAIPPYVWKLIDRFWPGPLTLVLPAAPRAPSWLTLGGSTIAVRVPGNRACLEVLQSLGVPVIGTSANVTAEPAAVTATDAIGQLGSRIDAVLEDDRHIGQLSSTIVDCGDEEVVILRPGAIDSQMIREELGVGILIRDHLTSIGVEAYNLSQLERG